MDSFNNVLILYGTQTYNSKLVSEEIARECYRRHIKTLVLAMDEYNILDLPTEKVVIFVVATTGNGEPPLTMKKSWKFLLRKDLPVDSLSALRFTVFGLGDSSYEKFNAMAKKLYQRLIQLGAKLFHSRAMGDDQHDFGYDAELDPWMSSLWDSLYQYFPELNTSKDILPEDFLMEPKYCVKTYESMEGLSSDQLEFMNGLDNLSSLEYLPAPSETYNTKVCNAKMELNSRLTSESHDQDVRHIVLSIDEDVEYYPGDICIIQPQNDPKIVEDFIKNIGYEPSTMIEVIKNPKYINHTQSHFPQIMTIRELFEYWLNLLGTPNRYFFYVLSQFTDDELHKEKLMLFASKTKEGKNEYHRYCKKEKRTVPEVLWDFNTSKPPLEYLIDTIGPQAPREFSISSAHSLHINKIHLTMGVVKYLTRLKREKLGLCSNWLARMKPGDKVKIPIWLKPGTMRLPKSCDTPIIMVGPGTGIAPFMGFIHERSLTSSSSNNILFFGCRYNLKDFYYEKDLLNFVSQQKLTLITAFSRDQESKCYVQHKIKEHGKLVADLIIHKKANVYVSGSVKLMPKSVEKAILIALQTYANLTDAESMEYIAKMKRTGRYMVEAW